MANAVAFAEWGGVKINFVDTPGFHMFLHEARAAMLPVEAALVVINAQSGIEAVTDRVWNFADEFKLPRMIVINQMDHPKADSRVGRQHMIEAMQERWGRQVVPVQLPIVDEQGFHGVVDLVTMEAFFYTPDGDGRGEDRQDSRRPLQRRQGRARGARGTGSRRQRRVDGGVLREGTIPEEHLITALHEAIREDRIFPVLYASGLRNVGTDHLLDFLKVYAPSPAEREPVAARSARRSRRHPTATAAC